MLSTTSTFDCMKINSTLYFELGYILDSSEVQVLAYDSPQVYSVGFGVALFSSEYLISRPSNGGNVHV